MKKSITYCCLLALTLTTAFAQRSMVIGTNVTDRPNAILILNPPGSDQGFLLPQLTTTNRLAMNPNSPGEDGLVVFDITEKSFYYWKENTWNKGLGGNQTLAYDPVTHIITLSGGNTVSLAELKELPVQSGQDGKFLTTDGTTVSWATVASLGDILGVTAGPGLTGGGLSGDVTLAVNTDGTTISINGSNQLQLADNAVTQNKISMGSVTSAKILDGTVSTSDLADAAVNTLKLADGSVTSIKIQDATILTADLANAAVTPQKISAGANNTILTTNGSGTVAWADQVAPSMISASGATANNVLMYNGTNWVPQNLILSGDVTGSPNTTTVEKIQGVNVSSAVPADDQVLQYDQATSQWRPATLPTAAVSIAFKAQQTTSQSINLTNVPVQLLWANEIYDESNNFNTATGRFVAPSAGIYHFDVQVSINNFNKQETGELILRIGSVTFTDIQRAYGNTGQDDGDITISLSTDVKLNANDQVSAWVQLPISRSTMPGVRSQFSGRKVF